MPTQYDPLVLQQYADDLYTQAKWIIFGTALRYFLVALLLAIACAALLMYAQPGAANGAGLWIMGIFSIVGVGAGIDAGKKKAFELKLKAQQILCQVQIEQNTRSQEKSLAANQS